MKLTDKKHFKGNMQGIQFSNCVKSEVDAVTKVMNAGLFETELIEGELFIPSNVFQLENGKN